MVAVFREQLTQVRANIVSIELIRPTNIKPELNRFAIQTREGLLIEIRNPSVNTVEKARLAVALYTGVGAGEGGGLSNAELMRGRLSIYDSDGEGIDYDYASSCL